MAAMMAPVESDDEHNNYSDEETDSLNGHTANSPTPELKAWDLFRVLPPQKDLSAAESEATMNLILRWVKLLICIIVFLVVLGCGVLAKGTILFMAAQTSGTQQVDFCYKQISNTAEKRYVAKLPLVERVGWTWALFFALIVPEVLSLMRSIRMCVFKSFKKPPLGDFLLVMSAETLHAIGIGILAFVVFPELDILKAAMLTNCVCVVPGILGLLSEHGSVNRTMIRVAIDIVALAAQVTGFIIWPLVENEKRGSLWFIPLALFLVSFGWWENFVSQNSALGFVRYIAEIKERAKKWRYFTYLFASAWKMIVLFVTMIVVWAVKEASANDLFSYFGPAFYEHKIQVMEVRNLTEQPQPNIEFFEVDSTYVSPLWLLLIQALSAHICYISAKYACRIMIQGFSFALAVSITVPMTLSVAVVLCGLKTIDPCYFHNVIPDYLFFRLPPVYYLGEFLSNQHAWIWLIWLASQAWFTAHIWWPKCERLARTEKLFVTPMYSALLIDQSLALNRRIDDSEEALTKHIIPEKSKKPPIEEFADNGSVSSNASDIFAHGSPSNDHVTRIYACATMWHETKEEMMEILKSIFRMDEDQSARRMAQQWLQIVDPDYYEFETHIFFDDAFLPEYEYANREGPLVNAWVKTLVSTIDEAASHVHNTHVRLRAPKKVPTPYGGKLIWTLPGKTKLITHLKDKNKIRHKKRWSQVMYMYYLLGHRLMEKRIPAERKEVIAENTYLLALDGDIDFQPNSVQLLVDLMKKNKQLGAACGRIHPIGSGAMVWYQKFEYAVGHWLQKATEHMIGCVLCSPGCFSLFRGKALMDDNVMRKYTTRSDEARHYVQYDQGEDRWLCTLLLQRGYRVEYSAASDAFTHCPEGFNEFYNQRRRWVPSTMANIMDLLGDYKRTVKMNDNLSFLYMIYQGFLLVGSVLGPGTIFLMLVGAFVAAFQINQWLSFSYNLIPVTIFMVICYFAKEKTQLTAAMIISTLYAMVMIAVLVGIMMQISEDGPLAPSSLFFFVVSGQLIVTGLLHPREVGCLPFGVVYYITVPSMYMLLIIYSLFNLNNVSWGTREVAVPLSQQAMAAEEAKKGQKKGAFSGLLDSFRSKPDSSEPEDGAIEFSLTGLFKCMLCTYPKVVDEKQQLMRIADSLEALNRRMDSIERSIDGPAPALGSRRRSFALLRSAANNETLGTLAEAAETDEQMSDDSEGRYATEVPIIKRDDLTNPFWMEDAELKKGDVDFLSGEEEHFWRDLIDKYLYPLEENKKQKEKIASDLKMLRDKMVFGFFMLNAMFVMILFLIQLNKDLLHFNWPLGVKTNITFDYNSKEIWINNEYLELEPIGIVFLFSFAALLFIQFFAMLFHRFGTLSHILASTELEWYCTKKVEDITEDALMAKYGIEFAKDLSRLTGSSENDTKKEQKERLFSIVNLEHESKKKQQEGSLPTNFETRFTSMDFGSQANPILRRISARRGTMEAFTHRRSSVLAERRKSLRMGSMDMGRDSIPEVGLNRRIDSVVSWRDTDA
ncbi:chitin synthase chs-2-like [Neocloeon triangulifer]|uniref:chitin synthase chs-2-like n=1 Tax=Neocloeon triangulifer TaxID=2078957 RepID=UPI00286ED58B|nr:chitin synthase chs-2-like [Neocloeon triangulifer]